ncbi:MAG: VOC family protein [Verrucomicrobiaceae bacterium]|nr:MAG: VOC family protein [Verrucomicrobiaceae bacterium]
MTLSGLHHVAVICSDYPVSKRFYTEVLGLRVISEIHRKERDSWKLDLEIPGGTQIELFSFPGSPARLSYPEALGLRHLAFRVRDLDQDVAGLVAKGVSVEDIRTDELTGKRFTFFGDPDGLPIELYEE